MGVNALGPLEHGAQRLGGGHPRLPLRWRDVDARNAGGRDGAASSPLLVRLQLLFQGSQLGEWRIRVRLTAATAFGRVAPLTWLIAAATIALLGAPPLATRSAILTLTLRTAAPAALALLRTAFPLALFAAFCRSATSVARAIIPPR